jgi:TPR repeat protein
MYEFGSGVAVDEARAMFWYRKAAAQGNASAQANLGWAYEHGEGVAKDDVLAYASYAIAAREGNEKYVSRRDGIASGLTPQQIYAWLVKGPYLEDPSKTVRRLILSTQDISAVGAP